MKKLFESWHKYLTLQEEMITPQTLPKEYFIHIAKSGREILVEILIDTEEGFKKVPANEDKRSLLRAVKSPFKCIDAYEVKWVNAPKGFGPLLYDIAMEMAGDVGIYSDRTAVSGQAEHIWTTYENDRDDVESYHPLDVLEDTYENDECINQVMDAFGEEWDFDATNRIYRKIDGLTPMLDALKKSRKLIK